jgi:hypothetical protein
MLYVHGTGQQACTKLRELKLQKVTDLSCIRTMSSLRTLTLVCSDIVDITALASPACVVK